MIRRLALMLALGAALVPLRAWLAAPDRPALAVQVPRGADPTLAIREAVLLETAIEAGWAETDPLIRDRLARNVAVAEPDLPPAEARALALTLGMHQRDPVVRRRLIGRAEAALAHAVDHADPGDPVLARWLADHPAPFTRPVRLRFEQELESGAPLLTLASGTATVARLSAVFGPGFGEAVARTPVGTWSPPIASPFGRHHVHLLAVEPATLPPLHDVRAAVLQRWRAARRAEAVAAGVQRLAARFDLHITSPGADG